VPAINTQKCLLERRAAFNSSRRERHEQGVATTRSAGSGFFQVGQQVTVKPEHNVTQQQALTVCLFEWLKNTAWVERALNGARMEVVHVGKCSISVKCFGSRASLPTDVLQRVSGRPPVIVMQPLYSS
jgi:hypothetical protein